MGAVIGLSPGDLRMLTDPSIDSARVSADSARVSATPHRLGAPPPAQRLSVTHGGEHVRIAAWPDDALVGPRRI
ncbi:hypothetical protein ACQPYK_19760 [Streptosporangium sp. CA-135522]|uniref:hypothetical protein n=1 Tax=Streptosporangium sp. CA-135522 TaxID=3240072 RepID=UPI003D8A4846